MRISLSIVKFDWPEPIGEVFGRIAAEADDAGVTGLWVMDHYFQAAMLGPPEEPMLEGYTALGFAAARTRRIRLGTLVTGVVYRHPGILIKTVSTLDALSGGRACLGLGAAWYEAEARGLGVPFPPVAERFERLEETLRIAHRMRAGDTSPYEGRHYRLERPINSPAARPPILVGGGGEGKTLRLVAEYADACNLFAAAGIPVLRHKLDVLREHCRRAGRPYDEIEKTTYCGEVDLSPGGLSVERAVEMFHEQAEAGIDHAIISLPGPRDPAEIERLGEVAARLAKITPAGRAEPRR